HYYEANVAAMATPLAPLFETMGVTFVAGIVETINTDCQSVGLVDGQGQRSTVRYDRLILASGSRAFRPDVSGLADRAYSMDQLDEAMQFEAHLNSLADIPDSAARN